LILVLYVDNLLKTDNHVQNINWIKESFCKEIWYVKFRKNEMLSLHRVCAFRRNNLYDLMRLFTKIMIEFGMDKCNMCLVLTHDKVKLLVDMDSKELNPTSIRGLLGN